MRLNQLTLAILATALWLFISSTSHAQVQNPVKWAFTAKKINSTTFEVHLTATIDAGWHLFSQQAGEGPVSTSIRFGKNPLAVTSGKPKEVGKMIKKYDADFHADVRYYEKQVDLYR